jgi:hypothetical protein
MCVFERSDIDGKDRSIANSHEQFPWLSQKAQAHSKDVEEWV